MCTLPAQLWNASTQVLERADEENLMRKATQARRAAQGTYGFLRGRDIVEVDGRWFYRASAITALRGHMTSPELALAIVNMLHAAESPRQTLITRPRMEQDSADRVLPDGRRTRGPLWSEHDEQVLRRWFSVHEYGPHKGGRASPTPAQWEQLLGEMERRRTRLECRSHMRVMNRRLRIGLMVDGFLTREGLDRYVREALGEGAIRVPRHRPRLRGRNYRDDSETPMEGQPA